MRLIKPLILTSFLIGFCSIAEASSIGFGATTYSQDTLRIGDTLRIYTYIKNYDTNAYNSTLSFKLKINGIQNVNPNLFPNPVQGQQLNLAPGDSLAATMIVVITPSYFLVGPDILVVWPYPTDGDIAHDSLIKQIYVLDYGTGINDGDKGEFIRTWLQNGDFHIYTDGIDIDVNHVSFYNLYGEQVMNSPASNNTSIPFGNLPSGLYIAEIVYNGNQKKLVKFSK